MDPKQMISIAKTNQDIARWLGDKQNENLTLSAQQVTKIVNALLDSGNSLEHFAKQQQEKT